MDWSQQRTSEGRTCGEKGKSVLLCTSFSDLIKGSTVKGHSVLKSSCTTGMPKPWFRMTLAEMRCETSSRIVMVQSLVDNTASSWRRKQAETLETAITRSPSDAAVFSPGPRGSNDTLAKLWSPPSALSLLWHTICILMIMVKWLDQFGLKQINISDKYTHVWKGRGKIAQPLDKYLSERLHTALKANLPKPT